MLDTLFKRAHILLLASVGICLTMEKEPEFKKAKHEAVSPTDIDSLRQQFWKAFNSHNKEELINIFKKIPQALIAHGFSMFPLIYTVAMNSDTFADMLEALIKAGANINQKHQISGETPLMAAAEYGNIEMFTILLSAGADIDARNKNNKTVADLIQESTTLSNATKNHMMGIIKETINQRRLTNAIKNTTLTPEKIKEFRRH